MTEGFDVAPFDLNRWLICMVGATIAVRSLFVLFKRLGIPCAPNREVLLLVGMGVVMVIFSRHYIYAAAVTVIIVGANFHTRWREWRDETGERRTSDDAP